LPHRGNFFSPPDESGFLCCQKKFHFINSAKLTRRKFGASGSDFAECSVEKKFKLIIKIYGPSTPRRNISSEVRGKQRKEE
jgi:hypothetical protein